MVTRASRIKVTTESPELIRQTVVQAAIACEAAKRLKDAAAQEFAEVEQRYIDACMTAKKWGVETSGIEFIATNGVEMQATFVDGTGGNSRLDEAALAKKITKTAWRAIVEEVISSAKLKAAIAAGVVKAEVVAMCTTPGDKKSFGKFTPKTARVTAVKTARRRIPVS